MGKGGGVKVCSLVARSETKGARLTGGVVWYQGRAVALCIG